MNNEQKIQDIHERIYQFVIRVINLVKQLPKTPENIILIQQVTRSATSMGANDQEADGTDSRKDFVAKYAIVRKESKETNYWLRVIADTNDPFRPRMQNLMQEGKEIVKIVSSIIIKTKGKKIN
ncbi:MAG: four helix bundle protein [Candidatus Levybacteria bacterium]|nr:four helix bundle protein [Candidatus Levybacteria bacterium]